MSRAFEAYFNLLQSYSKDVRSYVARRITLDEHQVRPQ
jgi:hypothetical protein